MSATHAAPKWHPSHDTRHDNATNAGHKWTSDAEKNLVLRMKSTAEDLAVAMTQPGRKANPLTAEMKTMAEELELAMEHQEEIHEVFVRASEDASS